MYKTLKISGYVIGTLAMVYMLAVLLVGMCLLDTSKEVNACRDNSAGKLVYASLAWLR